MAAITPESELERALLATPELRHGLAWGTPRAGHPEGPVAEHAAAMLACVPPDDPLRADLRFLVLLHDSFKAAVDPHAGWSPENDHAMLARRFAQRFTDDERLLVALELHDEPYWQWRHGGELHTVLDRVPDPVLFARFVELDASSEGKDLTFLWWFRRELVRAGVPMPDRIVPPGLAPGEDDILYVKTFATTPEEQEEVASAARGLVAGFADRLDAEGEVLVSDDGLRVVLAWRWRGALADRLLRDGDVVRDGLAMHPVLARAQALEAHVYRRAG